MKKILARLIGWCFNTMVYIFPQAIGHMGFYLFCRVRRGPMKDYQQEFLNSAERASMDTDGTCIQIYVWGKGPKKILFLHGWESHSFRWKNYIEALPKNEFTIYAIDAPGHGLSAGKHLNLIIYSNVVEKFLLKYGAFHAIVSHSFGGITAIYTLFRYPMPVERLIVMAAPGEMIEFVNQAQKLLGLSQRTMKAIRKTFDKIVYHQPEYYSTPRFARGLHLPGLIIHDEEDQETLYRHAIELRKAWKNSRLVTTKGLGHNLRSPQVVKEVTDFLTTPVVPHLNGKHLEVSHA